MTAFMPEPHILLTVVQVVDFGRPAPSAAWRAGRLALACREHAAEDHFFDVIARESRPLDGGPDRGGAELGRLHVLEVALEAAHRRARRTDDNDGI